MNYKKDEISILIVDDDSLMCELLSGLLEDLGYKNIELASNGTTALGKLISLEVPVHLIFCDLNMPEMDGIEFMRHAAKGNYRGGIVLLSGEDARILETAHSLARTHGLNILGSLSKPISPDKIKDLLSHFKPFDTEEVRLQAVHRPISKRDLLDGIQGSAMNQVFLVYQPKISIRTGKVIGVETLSRWWNMERGVLSPAAFIPVAESTNLIDELSEVICNQALTQAAEWSAQGRNLKTAINFSVNSFAKPKFVELINNSVVKYKLNSNDIILEITETQAINIEVGCLEALIGFRLKRFGLSIDDFGTGNSSMAQLKNIPFTEMKIDRAFVHGAIADSSALAILEASVEIAKKLNMEIVAEGVETMEDWDLVERLGCDFVQGFYCAKPMRNEDLLEFIESWHGPH